VGLINRRSSVDLHLSSEHDLCSVLSLRPLRPYRARGAVLPRTASENKGPQVGTPKYRRRESESERTTDLFWERTMESKKVIIFDTTLRDGEQAPGCSLGPREKMQVAEQLYRLGVDVIEAGFPVSSRGDFEAVQSIARVIGRKPDAPEICGL